jgi:hypothetical protein
MGAYVKYRKRRAKLIVEPKPWWTDWKWIVAVIISVLMVSIGILGIRSAM